MNEEQPRDSVDSIAPEANKLADTSNPAAANAIDSLEPGATGPAEPSGPASEKVESGGATSEHIHADDADAEARMQRMSRRSFIWGGAAIGGVLLGRGVINSTAEESGIPWPFRLILEGNEHLARAYFRGSRLAPTFPRHAANSPKPNNDLGLSDDFDPESWQLAVYGVAVADSDTPSSQDDTSSSKSSIDNSSTTEADTDSASGEEPTETSSAPKPLRLTLEDIKHLPRFEMTTQFKCIEGWSVIVNWAGARFSDFAKRWPPVDDSGNPLTVAGDFPAYVSLVTPNERYYVGLDRESALHPQTLLCYEMNGESLPLEHGGPLRLVIPVKYGIKHIKRIGTIRWTNTRPPDYWAERGYDWYAGH